MEKRKRLFCYIPPVSVPWRHFTSQTSIWHKRVRVLNRVTEFHGSYSLSLQLGSHPNCLTILAQLLRLTVLEQSFRAYDPQSLHMMSSL
jgi:hypothetical protein